jgi:hypothetical protein
MKGTRLPVRLKFIVHSPKSIHEGDRLRTPFQMSKAKSSASTRARVAV